MARSDATTVEEYFEALPPERREAIAVVRDVVRRHLPEGYEEAIAWGMISWQVPLARCPDTYNGKPLGYAALAAQKRYNSLYLMAAYADSAQERRLREGFRAAGKKLDMGKSCIRFSSPDDLALDVIGEVVASLPPEEFIRVAEAARRT